jgi:hypothetical protein
VWLRPSPLDRTQRDAHTDERAGAAVAHRERLLRGGAGSSRRV